MGGYRERGSGHKILKQTQELRYSAFSQVESAVVPFEVREGMEGEPTPETGSTRFSRRETSLKACS